MLIASNLFFMANTWNALFSRSLEDYRRAKGLTQYSIAQALNISQPAVSLKLRNHTGWTLDDAETISAAFPDFAVMFPLFMEEV